MNLRVTIQVFWYNELYNTDTPDSFLSSGLLDELRHDLVFKRGSNSSRKRAAKGKDPFNSVLPDLDLDGIPDDPFSPLHDVIK